MNAKSLQEINREGLAALKERLGASGMTRFLQQFSQGGGDYAAARHEWVERTSIEQIRAASQSAESPFKAPRTRQPRLATRRLDPRLEISSKHGNILIGTLRKIYGRDFAAALPKTAMLSDVLATLDEASLHKLMADQKSGALARKIRKHQ